MASLTTSRRVLIRQPRSKGARRVCCLIAAFAATLAHAANLRAQSVGGAGDDAVPVPKGTWRLRVGGLWNDYTAVFAPDASGGMQHRALLATLTSEGLGTKALPQLLAAEQAIRSLSARADYSLSLGTFEAVGDVRQTTIPFVIDRGITRRVSVGLIVPYVESRNRSQLVLNRNGTTANVGQNPVYSASSAAAAKAANGTLLRQLAQARTQLASEIARCANASAAGCTQIRANPAGAQALLQQALNAQTAIASVYGDSTRAGSPVVPIAGTDLNSAILSNIASIRTGFQGFGVTALAQGAAPASATLVYGPGSLSAIAGDTAFDLRYKNTNGTRRTGVGDIDLTVTTLLRDTFEGDQKRRLNNTGRAFRSAIAAGFRFGSAGADRVEDPLDVPIGEGASALLLRSTSDFVLSRRFWMSVTARFVAPFGDDIAVALPLVTDSSLFRSFTIGRAHRTLGLRTEIELAPRFMFAEFFGLSGAYLFRHVGTDKLSPLTSSDASSLLSSTALAPQTTPALSVHLVSVAASFSSLASYMRGGARFPVELQFVHTAAIRASGGIAPITSTDRLELRLYRGFPRR